MPEVTTLQPWWAALAPVTLLTLAAAGAAMAGAQTARRRGDGPLVAATTPLTETWRLLRQRRRVPVAADRVLWHVAVGGLPVVAVLMAVVVPLGSVVLVDSPVGVVWFNAMDVMLWALWWLAGWGPNSTHSLVAGHRFLGLALAYELPLMFALTSPAIAAHSLRLADVASAQQGLWFAVWMPVAFGVYLLSAVAFSSWGPFAVAAHSDLAGGVLAETSGVDRWLVLAGRHLVLAAAALVAVPLFLGGGAGPVLGPVAWTLVKALVVLAVLELSAGRAPMIRPERFAEVGWMVLLPATVLQMLVAAGGAS
ncbi:NADH-quinone oxidoreductase subunit H [Isoptericola sp. b441]|uniref:NADH-quinone oxidoreductase subunit H n=1 Tax=Actinotalea lenta TaxID=3064654 RepID=A0ABT9D9R9_9CELL|nr:MULTISPECIES: NADH-quinone oxidoreductase subunit H [unclassified Isoptericola]MDO8107626.1 NADH-quinone oxidoreductase subunit H [Isoptericola sp. b441]MDO8120713.1 NADH-quinone oxidoreductase subunit H [Isoptericola sp. b490]